MYMTYEEARKIIETAIAEVEWNYPLDYDVAFETAKEALDKQIPKKPQEDNVFFRCPTCSTLFTPAEDYCNKCGQKIDWSDLK